MEEMELFKIIDQNYRKETLLTMFEKYFLSWIADGHIGKDLDIFDVSLMGEDSPKQKFVKLYEEWLQDKDIFLNTYKKLDDDVKNIIYDLTWNGEYLLTDNQELNMIHRVKRGYKELNELKPEYSFFNLHYPDSRSKEKQIKISLPIQIIKLLRNYLEKPNDYYLNSNDDPVYDYFKSSEIEIQDKLSVYFNFYKMDEINMSSSNKMLKSAKKAMKKYCNIDEYYKEGGDLEFLKTETIALFILSIKEELRNENIINSTKIKELVNMFLDGELISSKDYNYTGKYLNYLKGIKNIWNEEERLKDCLVTIKQILQDIPKNGVISIENIIKYIDYRDLFIEIVAPQNVYDYLYINEADYGRTKVTDFHGYKNYITIPFVKSIFTILGVLGIVDLYYNYPSSKNGLYLKSGYLTKFDGLKYIKINPLGEYVLGKKNDYKFSWHGETDSSVYLDNDRLIITLMGEAPMKVMFLEQVGQKISNNKFLIDNESFLKGIEDVDSLNERLEKFKEKICNNPSQIWIDFFENLKSRIGKISFPDDIKVIKLSNDAELINLVVKDDIIKKLILKAEGYYILVKDENLKELLKRFRMLGYLI